MKKYIWGAVAIVVVVVLVVLAANKPAGSTVAANDLAGKNIAALSALNQPIDCTKPVLDSEKPAAGIGTEIPTEFWILGDSIKESGVTIQTDGSAGPTSLNIISENIAYTALSDSSNAGKMMAIEDKQFVDSLHQSFNGISASSLTCSHASFDASVFKPASVCYAPTSKNKPTCVFGGTY